MNASGQEFRRPLSVLVVIYTDDAKILLLKRQKPFEFWQSVTGSLQDGESHAQAACRELDEETGIQVAGNLSYSGTIRTFEIDPRWRYRFAPGTVENVEHEWQLRLPEVVDVMIDANEHSDYQWLPIAAAIDAVWSWTNKEALQELREKLREML